MVIETMFVFHFVYVDLLRYYLKKRRQQDRWRVDFEIVG